LVAILQSVAFQVLKAQLAVMPITHILWEVQQLVQEAVLVALMVAVDQAAVLIQTNKCMEIFLAEEEPVKDVGRAVVVVIEVLDAAAQVL
jgi:hypothetical protein